ncbi:Uncharacterised protein [Yersinia pseudotuberculosis]|nr:Uncharacterised protein [Yersinia pseudotuberculosis]
MPVIKGRFSKQSAVVTCYRTGADLGIFSGCVFVNVKLPAIDLGIFSDCTVVEAKLPVIKGRFSKQSAVVTCYCTGADHLGDQGIRASSDAAACGHRCPFRGGSRFLGAVDQ